MTDEHDRSGGRFLRGLTIGAILGAIIAGSRIWARSRPAASRRRRHDPEGQGERRAVDVAVPHDIE